MDRALHKLYSGRKELRKTEPAFLRGAVQTKVPVLALHELRKNSVDNLRSPFSDTCRLPKIARQSSTLVHPTRSMSSIKTGASRNTSSMTFGAEDPPKYVTLKAAVEQIVFTREESEEDLGLQVALSIDAMTSVTRVHRNQKKKEEMELEIIEFSGENFIFHMNGSPVGTMLLVKLLGIRRSEPIELGTALFDLSDIVVGGPSEQITCVLEGKPREVPPTISLNLKLCPRRKSFTFSYLREEPLFHSSGYTITAEGLSQFPTPYRKAGLPFDEKLGRRLNFSDLHVVGKCAWADEIEGLEVLRAIDGRGGTYTIKKFSIMRTECRDLLISSLDGMLDGLHGTTFKLCDAFLIGAEVCVVMDEMGGIYVRDSLQMNGACPEMVASIILRQVLVAVQYLHEVKSRLHLDIDARNIICMKSGECRLGGFCYSVKHIGKTNKFSGPFCHMSPERLLGLESSFAADVWSIGILAMELALGHSPYDMTKFEGPNGLFEFRKMVTSEESPTLKGVKGVSDIFRRFVVECLHKNKEMRASPSELLKHPFINRYESFLLPAGSWMCKQKPLVAISMNIERYPGERR